MLRIWASDTQRCLLKKGIAMEFPHEKSGGVRVTTRWVLGWFLGPLNMYLESPKYLYFWGRSIRMVFFEESTHLFKKGLFCD